MDEMKKKRNKQFKYYITLKAKDGKKTIPFTFETGEDFIEKWDFNKNVNIFKIILLIIEVYIFYSLPIKHHMFKVKTKEIDYNILMYDEERIKKAEKKKKKKLARKIVKGIIQHEKRRMKIKRMIIKEEEEIQKQIEKAKEKERRKNNRG